MIGDFELPRIGDRCAGDLRARDMENSAPNGGGFTHCWWNSVVKMGNAAVEMGKAEGLIR